MLWACLDAFRIRVWANTAGSTHFSRCAHQQAVSSFTWNLRAAARSPITGAQALTFSFVSELCFRGAPAAGFTALDSTLIVRHHPCMRFQFNVARRHPIVLTPSPSKRNYLAIDFWDVHATDVRQYTAAANAASLIA